MRRRNEISGTNDRGSATGFERFLVAKEVLYKPKRRLSSCEKFTS